MLAVFEKLVETQLHVFCALPVLHARFDHLYSVGIGFQLFEEGNFVPNSMYCEGFLKAFD